ncbi:hypothetical protein HYC85_012309 [Camellia sinensis]|uniref:Uncharacterized protein n=1 Tax=Camellia sinensis TaxID=4442 RepID=A0A7J7HES9_CAMSI|nr:hypothetical protein HYC85_012309 [Camellia sinensis]
MEGIDKTIRSREERAKRKGSKIDFGHFDLVHSRDTLLLLLDKPYNKDDDVIKTTSFETRNAISGTYLASQRFASSAALLVGDPTAMRDHEMFVLIEDTAGSTVA